MRVILKNIFFIGLIATLFTACEEDFDLVTEYKDQTVVYAFLEHKDPWSQTGMDTNWVVVNKAFLGEAKVSDMASVSDSVNYSNYDDFSVTLQRIKTIDPKSGPVSESTWNHEPIVLHYTTHYKDTGAFATDNNVVFYTTKQLMFHMDVPRPEEDKSYFYKLSIKKDGKEEVYATTKILRGIDDYSDGGILAASIDRRVINMASAFPNYTFKVKLKSNLDARLYKFKIRTFYYEKRTDGKVYLDYVDYEHPMVTTREKNPSSPESMLISIDPLAWYSSFDKHLHNTDGVVWRAIKINSVGSFTETHALMFTIGSQETYVYNQVTMPSDGIVQEKPSYSNITNGIGLFTSKWNYYKNHYKYTSAGNYTLDSLANGVITKNLKFLDEDETGKKTSPLQASDITKRY